MDNSTNENHDEWQETEKWNIMLTDDVTPVLRTKFFSGVVYVQS